jgi:hypothetical protein
MVKYLRGISGVEMYDQLPTPAVTKNPLKFWD